MNRPSFYGSKVEEDPQEFIDEVYNILYAMRFSTSEKAELATYQLKDVAQAWYVQWRVYRTLRGCPVTWEILKKAFIDQFFPRNMRKAKVVEFINLRQGGLSVHEYSLKFTKLSKYAPYLVSNPRDEMSPFVTGVSDDLTEECHSAMLHDNVNISHTMVHAQHLEEAMAKRKSRDSKRVRYFNGVSSKNRLEIQHNPRFKKWVSNQVPSKFPKARDNRVANLKSKKGRDASSPNKKSICAKCGKKHVGECLV